MEDLPKKTALFGALTLALYLILFFFVDRDVDRFVHENLADSELFGAGSFLSEFAYGAFYTAGLALCFLVVVVADSLRPSRWTRALLYICLSVSVAMIFGEGLKYLAGRYRPVMLFEHGLYGFEPFATQWEMNSTPSGHTFRIFALSAALSVLFRRFTPLFMTIAAVVGLSRIAVTAHYPSDVLLGAYIGIFAALWTRAYFGRRGPLPRSPGLEVRSCDERPSPYP